MKKLPLSLSNAALAVLAVVIAVFALTLAYKPQHEKPQTSADSQPNVITGDIVYVNLDSLVRSYDMYFDLRAEFEGKAKSKESDFAVRRKKFETEMRDFQEKIEKGLVTRSQAQELQANLQHKEQELVALGQKMQADLAEEEAVMLRRIQDNIQKFIEEYNADKRYRLILSNASSSVVLYGDPALNITAEVLQGLNKAYVKVRR